MDRTTTNIAQSQTGFISFIILPSFGLMEKLLPKSKLYIDQISINKQNWEEKVADYAKRMDEEKAKNSSLQELNTLKTSFLDIRLR